MRQKTKAFLLLLTCVSALSCSSSPKPGDGSTPEARIEAIYPYHIHMRRPDKLVADPEAIPGDREYYSDPVPDERFGCKPLESLFDSLELEAVRTCLQQTKTRAQVLYRLRFEAAPYLELEEPETAPPCVREKLPRIQVPREIFFQAKPQDQYRCYSSTLNLKADQTLGLKLSLKKFKVKIEFPLPEGEVPKTKEETLALLGTWAMAPFWQVEPREIIARPFPRHLCERCMGKENVLEQPQSVQQRWPKWER